MADWYGTARSNYVKIKDMDGLKAAIEPFPISISKGDDENEGKVCFLSDDGDSGGWPGHAYDEDDNEIEFDPAVQICPFMEDDQVLVMMESGAEKLRYITGNAMAFNAKGDSVRVNLNDIYKKAAETFGASADDITAAEY